MSEVKLNKAQQEAVNHIDGPMLVVAGAGTGKTKVIVERIAKLIDSGVDRKNILALTFTEKASQEMLDRVTDRIGLSQGVDLNIYTFNAFGHELLSEFAIEIGLSPNLNLVGEEGKVVFMREHLDKLNLDYFSPVSKPDGQLSTIADYYSLLKQQLVTPKIYQDYANKLPASDEAEKLERKKHLELAKSYASYLELTRNQNIIDYDDQIFLAVEILKQRPNILKKLQQRFTHIMIDEFQDTNPMQSELIDLLYGSPTGARSLMVVGDDDQAIYGWRGATLANILQFTTKYPDAEQITLIENYRNTQNILDSAWTMIQKNNPNRLEHLNNLDKRLKSNRGVGEKPQVMEFTHRDSELAWVAEDIKKRIDDGQEPGSIAVLARSRQLVADAHKMLEMFDIDHVAAGLGEDLFNQSIVLMMVDGLRAVWNPQDNTALYHTLTGRLFDCDAQLVSQAAHTANSKKIPLHSILSSLDDKQILSSIEQIDQWHAQLQTNNAREMSFRILTESGLKQNLYDQATTDNSVAREVQALSQWFQSLQEFEKIATTPSVHSYLENFNVLRGEGETLRDDTLDISSDLPTVMTMHKAKGLEWQTVYVVGCKARSFPYLGGGSGLKLPDELKRISEADDRLSEERRLMYVSATRARDELIISYSTISSTGKTVGKPSQFIEELGLSDTEQSNLETSPQLEHFSSTKLSDVVLPASMRDGEKIVLSASKAEDYLDCPLNFYYKHVLNVPEEPNFVTEVGSLYHNIIETINKAKLNNSEVPSEKSLLKRLQNEWPEHGYHSQQQRKRDIEQGTAGFNELYERLVAEPVPVAVEDKFNVLIPDSKCVLKGRIDAVMPVEDGVEMHDYKTSTSVTTAEKAKSKTTSSKQLTMYALAWQLQTGETAKQVSLDYVRTGQIGVVKKTSRSLDTMAKNLTEAADNIIAGKYPKGAKHDYCIHP